MADKKPAKPTVGARSLALEAQRDEALKDLKEVRGELLKAKNELSRLGIELEEVKELLEEVAKTRDEAVKMAGAGTGDNREVTALKEALRISSSALGLFTVAAQKWLKEGFNYGEAGALLDKAAKKA
jgi:mevalonate kinase